MIGPILRLASLGRSAAGYVVLLLMVAQIVVVALRYAFSLGWPWALDLLVYCFYAGALLPALYVLVRDVSVRVDLFYTRWPQRRRDRIDRAALLVLVCPVLAYAGWISSTLSASAWAVLESSPTYGGLPGYFLLKTLLSLVLLVLSLAALAMAVRRAPYIRERSDEP